MSPIPTAAHTAPAWVDAAPFRAHIRQLIELTDLPWRALAVVAGVNSELVEHLLFGRDGRPVRRLHPASARALLRLHATDLGALSASRVRAAITTRQVRWLLSHGTSAAALAAFVQVPVGVIDALSRGEHRTCTRLTAVLVAAAADALACPVERTDELAAA